MTTIMIISKLTAAILWLILLILQFKMMVISLPPDFLIALTPLITLIRLIQELRFMLIAISPLECLRALMMIIFTLILAPALIWPGLMPPVLLL